jgi:hypothetical protein
VSLKKEVDRCLEILELGQLYCGPSERGWLSFLS